MNKTNQTLAEVDMDAETAMSQNAAVLEKELDWFYRILDVRLKLHFGHETSHGRIWELTPPDLEASDGFYARFACHYQWSPAERLVLLLCLF